MKTKLLPHLLLAALTAAAFGICPLASAQMDISPTPAPSMGTQPTPDAMNKMAEMCQKMMKSEKAMMPYIVGASILFGLLLLVALVLLIVLEIQWIKYWSHILKQRKSATG